MLQLSIVGKLQCSIDDIEACGWRIAPFSDIGVDGVFVAYDRFPPERLAGKVKVIGTNCSMPQWIETRVPVVTTRDPAIQEQLYSITPTSEFVISQIMYLNRRLLACAVDVWGDRNDHIDPAMLSRQTMLIIGYGRIGKAVARIAEAIGMTVWSVDVHPDPVFRVNPLAKLLPHADIVVMSAHTDGCIITAEGLSTMKPTALLVSISHPEAIDQEKALTMLFKDKLRGLALDCHTVPKTLGYMVASLVEQGRLLLTPHIAGSTLDARIETEKMVLKEMRRVCDD